MSLSDVFYVKLPNEEWILVKDVKEAVRELKEKAINYEDPDAPYKYIPEGFVKIIDEIFGEKLK